MAETTGKIPFAYNGETYYTWYKVFGDLKSGVRPLVVLHGGPGLSHHYMLPHATLATSHNIPVIFYDQIGIGESTHLSDKPKEFWTVDLFLDELDNLLKHFGIQGNFDLLGHSWGGMMAAHYVSHRQPQGLKHLVLGSATPSMQLWLDSVNQLLSKLPEDVQKTIRKHEQDGTTDSKEYQDAMQTFYKKHVCKLDPWPQTLMQSFEAMEKDPYVYSTMLGPSEFTITGTLRTWTTADKIQDISVPTLLLNGEDDEAQDVGTSPFFVKIARVKWTKFAHSAHMAFYEEPDRYFAVVGDFLTVI